MANKGTCKYCMNIVLFGEEVPDAPESERKAGEGKGQH